MTLQSYTFPIIAISKSCESKRSLFGDDGVPAIYHQSPLDLDLTHTKQTDVVLQKDSRTCSLFTNNSLSLTISLISSPPHLEGHGTIPRDGCCQRRPPQTLVFRPTHGHLTRIRKE